MVPVPVQAVPKEVYDFLVAMKSPGFQSFLLISQESFKHILYAWPGDRGKGQDFVGVSFFANQS
jgi:hypothetical protein